MKRTRFTQTAFHFTEFQIFDTRLPEAKAIAPMEAASFFFSSCPEASGVEGQNKRYSGQRESAPTNYTSY